ncbi:M56 family metallopeptidase [Microbulbifer sp. Q7]|uniref:M56 family metallopeptidase n=1 Tax=Microbulbifer sp. Q7 TaxID=1785091 RepID=UPI0008313277|nr:M56 family metallopeptidase [Microbulbifer sp. Q7]
MINWVLEQQALLTLVLLVVWLSDLILTKRIGAKFTYLLYLLIPLAIFVASLPPITLDYAASENVASNLVTEVIASTIQTANDSGIYRNITHTSTIQFQWIWLAGVIVLASGLAVGLFKLATLPKKPVLKDSLYDQLPNGIFYTSDKVRGPILKGIFRPEIILPSNYRQCYDSRQLQFVFEHELVHARRYDNLWNLLALALASIFWFNPIVWIVYLRFRLTQECACDEEVLAQASKGKKILYSRAMLQSYENWNGFWMLQSHYGDKVTMITRINRLKSKIRPSRIARFLAGGANALILSFAFLWGQVSASPQNTINLNDAKLLPFSLPRAAFIEGAQGEVHLQFDVTEGEISSIDVLDTVTSGGHVNSFIEASKNYVSSFPFTGDNANLKGAEYVVRFHIAGVGTSQTVLDAVTERMPYRKIHLLPYSIPSPANELKFTGTPALQPIKSHYPDYPDGLEALGISASSTVEFDVKEDGVAINTRVISVTAPAEYQHAFREVALREASNLNVFLNNSGKTINNVRVTLHWNPADHTKGLDHSKLK